MAYEKQTWTTGEVITADKLNHMEDGIAGEGGGSAWIDLVDTITISDGYTKNLYLNKLYTYLYI